MAVKFISRPAPVIDMPTLYRHLRLDPESLGDGTDPVHEDDALILGYLDAAVEYAEHYTGRSIGVQILELALDAFPASAIELPRGPVLSVQSVNYRDGSGQLQSIDPSGFALDNYGEQHWLVPAYGSSWPAAQNSANSLLVRYVAGEVTGAQRAALLLITAGLYANREDTAEKALTNLPLGVKTLLNTKKHWVLA
jgi:uncharacterized phiE125 gp8 family phage protein